MSEKLFEDTELKSGVILQGDILSKIMDVPSRSIQCVITSPPYYKVRDYGIEGQWGLEKSPEMYLDRLGLLMQRLWRVLKDDGIAWINLGDCIINGSWYGFPEMFFANCRKSGWKSVSKAIWYKRNAMPSSTKIRLTPRYEPIYGFAKNEKWYFDMDSIRVTLITPPSKSSSFNLRVREGKKDTLKKKFGKYTYKATENEKQSHDINGVKKQDSVLGGDGKVKANYSGFNSRWKNNQTHDNGKNPGDILDITVKPFKGGHFATFPEDLPEMLIKCSTKENDFVLDPFFGSGTVGVVAERLKRKWVGIELNPEFIRLANQRLENDRLFSSSSGQIPKS